MTDLDHQQATLLRDNQAIERTRLANERTLLAYVRTCLTLLIAGLSFIHLDFFANLPMRVIAWSFIGLSALSLAVGWWRYRRLRRALGQQRVWLLGEGEPR